MKRIVTAVFATASALVLLFTYKTSLEVVPPEAADNGATAATSSAGTGTGTDSSTGTSTDTDVSSDSSAGSSSGTTGSGSSSSTSTGSGSGTDTTTGSGHTAGTGSASGSTTSASGLVDGTYTGTAVNTRYGAVQVAVTVSGGVITDVQVPQYPVRDRKDQQINSVAVPELVQETLSAQSADIQMISGATYTSEGYVQSLQSALDQAAS